MDLKKDYKKLIPKEFRKKGVAIASEEDAISLGATNLRWLKTHWKKHAKKAQRAKEYDMRELKSACERLRDCPPEEQKYWEEQLTKSTMAIAKNTKKYDHCCARVEVLEELLQKTQARAPLLFKRPIFNIDEKVHIFTSSKNPKTAELVDQANLDNFISGKVIQSTKEEVVVKIDRVHGSWKETASIDANYIGLIRKYDASYLVNHEKFFELYLKAQSESASKERDDMIFWMIAAINESDER